MTVPVRVVQLAMSSRVSERGIFRRLAKIPYPGDSIPARYGNSRCDLTAAVVWNRLDALVGIHYQIPYRVGMESLERASHFLRTFPTRDDIASWTTLTASSPLARPLAPPSETT